jgi:8-oxo-dGTP diphosphatase
MRTIEVVAAVLVVDDRVFAARRRPGGETGGQWEFPGGKLEVGESHHAALVRELAEELCVRIAVGDTVMTVRHQYRDFALVMHAYFGTLLDGPINLTEHSDSRWLGRAELDSVDWAPADRPIVERLKAILPVLATGQAPDRCPGAPWIPAKPDRSGSAC